MTNTKSRITITVSEEDLAHWRFFNNRENFSAFIREAVNSHILTLETDINSSSTLDGIVQANSYQIQSIKEDLLEIQAALAKNEIIPDIDPDTRIKRFIEQRMAKTDISKEDRQTFEKIRHLFS